MKGTDDEIDFLLSKGRLSGVQRDAVLQNVLRSSRPSRPMFRPFSLTLFTGALVGAAALVLWVKTDHPSSELRAKGGTGASSTALSVELTCGAGPAERASQPRCPAGSKLLFTVNGAVERGHLSAFSEPAGGGERIWYFSAETGAPTVEPRPETQVLSEAVRIGTDHPPGDYLVHLFVTRRPLSRAELLAAPTGDVLAEARLRMTVTPAGSNGGGDASPTDPR
jgi:hypothetical protein